jgi:hypothetical protein
VFGVRRKKVTFFEKEVTKKTFAAAGLGTLSADHRRRWWGLSALNVPAPAVGRHFLRAFFL